MLVAWDARHHAKITEDVASAVDVVQDELLARLSQVAEPTFGDKREAAQLQQLSHARAVARSTLGVRIRWRRRQVVLQAEGK